MTVEFHHPVSQLAVFFVLFFLLHNRFHLVVESLAVGNGALELHDFVMKTPDVEEEPLLEDFSGCSFKAGLGLFHPVEGDSQLFLLVAELFVKFV